jgi:DNA-binding PadR family transcriptional regulator
MERTMRLNGSASDRYALDLSEPSLSAILTRLEADGWVEGEWDDINDSAPGRCRRSHSLTGMAKNAAPRNLAKAAARPAPPPQADTGSIWPRRATA